ncbi:MAG: SUMF1/EgtB/PvdO family nonheme iron enzyme, partial [Phycisphaerales bacterium]|nr:SUMF1/EgtB/PvdO family nonheme iron enzyme [Phycisphaerales bacterium]
WIAVGLSVLTGGAGGGGALAQSQPTPGLPSVPFAPVAQAQNGGAGPAVTYQYGIEFVTVNPLGPGGVPNAPYSAGVPAERDGSLGHTFRIGRNEVTSQQIGEFLLAVDQVALATGQPIPFVSFPEFIGGTGGQNPMAPAGGITWRTAAIFCNWLHNDRAMTRAAFMNGAYDVSTFGYVNGNIFTDQAAHNPGARFWIPTMDEMLASHHYDPNRYGQGQGGYWQYNLSQDTRPVYGPPGVMVNGQLAQANSGWLPADYPGMNLPFPFGVSLGAYADQQSPWGLLDAAGGTSEWTELVYFAGIPYRGIHGSSAAGSPFINDFIGGFTSDLPSSGHYQWGFRIAAVIPTPSFAGLATIIMFHYAARRNRRSNHDASPVLADRDVHCNDRR